MSENRELLEHEEDVNDLLNASFSKSELNRDFRNQHQGKMTSVI